MSLTGFKDIVEMTSVQALIAFALVFTLVIAFFACLKMGETQLAERFADALILGFGMALGLYYKAKTTTSSSGA